MHAKVMKKLPLYFVVLISAAWLVPNHYSPWLSAWNDGVAIFGLLLLTLSLVGSSAGGVRISWRLPAIAAVCGAVILAQLATGRLLFFGDAVMAIMYVALWLAAVLTGRILRASSVSTKALDALATGWCLAALLSVGIALVQWTGALSLNIYAVDLPPGARPFGNLGQPNHFCTLCFFGLCGLLCLHQFRKLSTSIFFLGAGFLLLGMVMSNSRTGWLQIGLLIAWGIFMRERANLRITRVQLLMLGAGFAIGVTLWPWICDYLLLSVGRPLDDQMRAGVRLPYWWSMIDAIGREPLLGYGWLQVGAAQLRVALDHPPMGALFDHSHNLLLDLLLWNGLPIGGLVAAILAWWFITQVRACRDARGVWLLAVLVGLFTHGLLEYPLTYAYFLVPAGLAMGATEGISRAGGVEIRWPRWGMVVFAVLLSGLFLAVAVEYFKFEERFRSMRFEMARIGTPPVDTSKVEAPMLTQLEALMEFYRTEATPGMPAERLEWMRKVSDRYGYPQILLRFALAAGLNGRPNEARDTLARICRIHALKRCQEARESWMALQARNPKLLGVMAPEIPKN